MSYVHIVYALCLSKTHKVKFHVVRIQTGGKNDKTHN